MTLRTKTLSAVSALLVGTAGLAFAQDSGTALPEAPPAAVTEAPAVAVEDATAADAAPAETVAGQEASEELQADQSADQSEAEEMAQDEQTQSPDDTAVEVTAAEENAPAGDEAETAEEMVNAAEPVVAEGETTEEADESAEHAVEEEEGGHEAAHIEDIAFSFEGPFGKFDQFQLQRGLHVFTEVCSTCHGLKQVAIRSLADEGGPALPEDQVRAYAATMDIVDPETGEERPRLPTDHFPTVTGDGMGPDLSLMAKARAGFHGPYGTGINQLFRGIGGPEYIHAIMVGYTGDEIEQAGTFLYGNSAFSTGYIGMPKPLSEDLLTYEDGTPATVDQMARDVAAFLMWAAEPKMMDRQTVGLVSVLFLLVLSALLYYTNKRLWAPHKDNH